MTTALLLLKTYWRQIAIISLIVACSITLRMIYDKHMKDAYNSGYAAKEDEYKEAQDKHEESAQENIKLVKKKARVIIKYIQNQNNDCDIYSNVIDRLPDPAPNNSDK